MISEIILNLKATNLTKTTFIEIICKDENGKEIAIKDNKIKNFWQLSDQNIISKIYKMLELPVSYSTTYSNKFLISKFLLNGGNNSFLKICQDKQGTIIEYSNQNAWGVPVSGEITEFANFDVLTTLNNLSIPCALINQRYSQIVLNNIYNEINEYLERKSKQTENFIQDINSLYGLENEFIKLTQTQPSKLKHTTKKHIKKSVSVLEPIK